MNSDKYYDFDEGKDNQIDPKYHRDDLLETDNNPIQCDNCPDGIRLLPYQQNNLICPRCMQVYNPTFDTIKHQTIETTIEEMQDTHSGELGFLEDTKHEPPKSKIRKSLDEDELPDYVKKEIDHIQWRPGYKTIPLDREKLSSTNP